MIDYSTLISRYTGKKVFITGHTGFKGTYLTYILLKAGAKVTGYSLGIPTEPSLFSLLRLDEEECLNHVVGDVRDAGSLMQAICDAKPDYVFHLAAQPIVRESYRDPVMTYETNVMGTVYLLDAIRQYSLGSPEQIISVLNVTTDKVYLNREWYWGYREDEPLDGYDPYSNSKSCSELVTHSYARSFFSSKTNDLDDSSRCVRVSTARAGNVIGGGDFAVDRIIPDSVRALQNACDNKESEGEIYLRNPNSIRPYQHVLEPLFAYLMIAEEQYRDATLSGSYNVGPNDVDCVTTGELVKLFSKTWERAVSSDNEVNELPSLKITEREESSAPHESSFLKLDNSKIKGTFGWRPRLNIEAALTLTAEFTKIYLTGGDLREEIDREIEKLLIQQ